MPCSCALFLYRYEEVLLQNAVADIFSDDLANLADEEGPGGSRQSSAGVAEAQSFTDLVYSKGKVSAVSLSASFTYPFLHRLCLSVYYCMHQIPV